MRRPLLTLLAAGLTLAGCSGDLRPPTALFLALGTNSEQRIDSDLRDDFQERLALLTEGFQQLHPDTTIQAEIYPGDQLIQAISRRERAGLEPDLLFVNGDTALRLLRDGRVRPFPAEPELLRNFDPTLLDRVRDPRGQLAGLPVLVQPQLSCFNRRQVPQAPRDLNAVLQLSAAGQAVGLPLDPVNLLWTAGSVGAMPALEQSLRRQPLSPAHRQAIARWMGWLREASGQRRVSFFPSQRETLEEFEAGRLAWIPCNSIELPQLERRLGGQLGVAPLPDGAEGQPAVAVNRVRVIALGRHSSPRGRLRALDYVRYAVNPLTQQTMTSGLLAVVPANRFVTLPVQSSQRLQAMQTAVAQGRQTSALVALIHSDDARVPQLQGVFTRLVFGDTSPAAAAAAVVRILEQQR
ncbi:MAG: extracellular solute-binding protein [Cyanobium sp.]